MIENTTSKLGDYLLTEMISALKESHHKTGELNHALLLVFAKDQVEGNVNAYMGISFEWNKEAIEECVEMIRNITVQCLSESKKGH